MSNSKSSFRRWLDCYRGKLFTFSSIEVLKAGFPAVMAHYSFPKEDFRGYKCSRCYQYHIERVFNTADVNMFIIKSN